MIETWKNSLTQSFEEQLLPRYQQLERREQKILLTAAIMLPLIIIVFGFILPLQDRQIALQKELSLAQNQAAKADSLANYLTAHAAELKSNNSSGSLLTIVDQLARQTQVRSFMTRIKPQVSPGGGAQRLMLSMKGVPYDAMLRFVHALAQRDLHLKQMTFKASKTAGHVHVHAIISEM